MGWLIILLIAFGCWLSLEKLMNVTHDSREPPLIPQKVPYIGHLLGLLQNGSRYYTKLSAKYSLPIYTLPVPRSKIYIVNSPNLVAAVDRHSKAISFGPYVVEFAKRILVPSAEALETLRGKSQHGNDTSDCREETLEVMHAALAPGTDLEQTTQDMVQSTSRLLDCPFPAQGRAGFELFAWARKLVTRASTDAIYGAAHNPFQDPAIENGFWNIDKDFALLGLNVFPDILAPAGSRGRKRLFQGFHEYYQQKGQERASQLVQARYEVNRKHAISNEDIEHFDLSVCYGLLVNTVPAVAWTLFYVYSQPSLLEEIRAAVAPDMHTSKDGQGGLTINVNIAKVIAGSPLLESLVQETLRAQSTNASGRVVLQDTLLENRYLLKQDSILLIPSAELHSDASVWGPSYKEFDPWRFANRRAKGARQPASAYRAFGSGDAVCPGRFFATNEIITILVMMVLKYDLNPGSEDHWIMPKSHPHITTSILTPTKDIKVVATERNGYEHVSWKFSWDTAGT